jgi:hypothetical protein
MYRFGFYLEIDYREAGVKYSPFPGHKPLS